MHRNCSPTVTLGGRKFYDANENGLFDPGEDTVAGVQILILAGSDHNRRHNERIGYLEYFLYRRVWNTWSSSSCPSPALMASPARIGSKPRLQPTMKDCGVTSEPRPQIKPISTSAISVSIRTPKGTRLRRQRRAPLAICRRRSPRLRPRQRPAPIAARLQC